MTTLLLRRLEKTAGNVGSPRYRSAVGALSGRVGIFCNLLLFTMKLITGMVSGSVSITADALNNLSDASGSIVTLVGFRLADKPADAHHPYGHARAEYLSGLAVAVLILYIGFDQVKSAVEKIFRPTAVEFTPVVGVVLLVSIVIKLWMYLFNRRLGKHIGSAALLATAADSRNDCVTTGAVLLSALAGHFFSLPVDGYAGLGVAAFILYSGWTLAKTTISPLLGENADPELRKTILRDLLAQPKVLGYHDLMIHDYGPEQRFASVHVEMDHREDPMECHDILDALERECLEKHRVHLVIHYDPVVTDDPALTRLREKTGALLSAEDPRLSLHDFRMVPGRRHTNLVFDVALPTDLLGREEAIRQALEDGLNQEGSVCYHLHITFDVAM